MRDLPACDLPAEDVYAILRPERRRAVIKMLVSETPPVSKRALADRLAVLEYGAGYSSSERNNVYVSLAQAHLPKLLDAGVIEAVGVREDEFEPTSLAFVLDEVRVAVGDAAGVRVREPSLRERLAAAGGAADV